MEAALAPVGPCDVCGALTPFDWACCGACGAQRLVASDATHVGFRPLAGALRRMLATLIDVFVFGMPLALTTLLPRQLANPDPSQPDEALATIIILAALIYPVVAVGATGRTVGKRLARVHVVADDGSPITYPRAAMRESIGKLLELGLVVAALGLAGTHPHTTGKLALAWALLALPGASVGLMFGSARRRSLHDRMAGTIVVRGAPVRRLAVTGTGAASVAPRPVDERQLPLAAPVPNSGACVEGG